MLNSNTNTIFEFNWQKEGFAATLHSMLSRIEYCLENNMYFSLNLPLSIGQWTDYFEPFWDEAEKQNLYKNATKIVTTDPRLPIYRIHREGRHNIEKRINLFNQKLFPTWLKTIYKLNQKTLDEVNKLRSTINLPKNYAMIHIRRGDRTHSKKCPTNLPITEYLPYIKNENLYIATDDFKTIDEFKKIGKFKLYHLCTPDCLGHTQKAFNESEKKHQLVIQLLTEIDLAQTSETFVGVYCSVLSHLMQMQSGFSRGHLIHKEK